MYSLYSAILDQHSRQLTPVRCAAQTIAQLHRYFEDVVLENSLAALVVESLPYAAERPIRDRTRVREMARAARNAFFFVRPGDALNNLALKTDGHNLEPVLLQRASTDKVNERFVVIADARFSALLASVRGNEEDGSSGDEVIWTFQPDIVYSALEYLMARVTAEQPYQAAAFSNAVSTSMPKATSLQLTVSVTTKLARLLQEQAGREIAINRIATSIRNSLKLDDILQTTVNEVGRALNAQHCALRVEGEAMGQTLTHYYFHPDKEPDSEATTRLLSDIDTYSSRLSVSLKSHVQDGEDCGEVEAGAEASIPLAVVPLIFHDRFMGTLLVGSDHEDRTWEENELLLLHTVADQVTVAVNQAHLFAQIEQQALTDGLTGCFNRRSFEIQLEKDLHRATRQHQPLSLIMLDVDNFKHVNDNSGHETGDNALRVLADCLREELREEDSASRFGGDEFAVILPHADQDGAMLVAERLRARVEQTDVAGFGPISASFGIATFPLHASSRDTLLVAADRALYSAKHGGRNRVCLPPADDLANEDEVSSAPQTFSDMEEQLPVHASEPSVPFTEIVTESF